MNKKVNFSLVVIIMIANFLFGAAIVQAQVKNDDWTFSEVYQKTLELNKDRFADLNNIQIGDTVLLPALSSPGVVAWIADKPTNDGQHDCLWRIAEKYLAQEIETVPADTIHAVIPKPIPPTVEQPTSKGFPWLIVMVVLLSLLLIAAAALGAYASIKKRRDPDSYLPMGGNLDNMSRENAISGLRRFLHDGETLVSLRRGRLVRYIGQAHIVASMEFGDNQHREIWLMPGERVATIIIDGPNGTRTQHLRSACSNGFGGESFILPTGWEIQYDESVAEGTNDVEIVAPATPVPATPPAFEVDYEAIARFIKHAKYHDVIKVEIAPNKVAIEVHDYEKKGKKNKKNKGKK